MAKNTGQVVTKDVLVALVGEAFVQSHTPLNIFGGFKKTGIYPFNPGEVSDRQLAPSRALKKPIPPPVATFTPEQIAKFEECYKEGYDVEDPIYSTWLNIYYPSKGSVSSAVTTDISSPGSSVSASLRANAKTSTPDAAISPSVSSSISTPETSASVVTTASAKSLRSSEEVLNELLVFPQAVPSRRRRRKALDDRAKESTDDNTLQEMKDKKETDA